MLSNTFARVSLKAWRHHPLLGLDLVISLALAGIAAAVTIWSMSLLGDDLWRETSFNLWFQADTPRVIANLTDASSDHYRVSVHPIAPSMLTSIVIFLEKMGARPRTAADAFMLAVASCAVGLFFINLRLLSLPRLPAIVFTLILLASAAFIHWAPIPELNMSSFLTIVIALTALAYGRTRSSIWWILVSSCTLGVTITNWSVGLAATFARWPIRRFFMISLVALIMVSVVALIQWLLFSRAPPFFTTSPLHEVQYTQRSMEHRGQGQWRPLDSLRSMFVTTISAPNPVIEIQSSDRVVTNQKSGYFDRTAIGIAVATAWLVVFVVGIWGGARTQRLRPVSVALGLMVLSQVALHSVYGNPTFLYAPHFLPILVMIAALSWFTPGRWPALVLAIFVVAAGGFDNARQFSVAAGLAHQAMAAGGNTIIPNFPASGAVLP